MHFYGWRGGLKTGMYYLRTTPSAYPMAPQDTALEDIVQPPTITIQSEDYEDIFGDLQLGELEANSDITICEACAA